MERKLKYLKEWEETEIDSLLPDLGSLSLEKDRVIIEFIEILHKNRGGGELPYAKLTFPRLDEKTRPNLSDILGEMTESEFEFSVADEGKYKKEAIKAKVESPVGKYLRGAYEGVDVYYFKRALFKAMWAWNKSDVSQILSKIVSILNGYGVIVKGCIIIDKKIVAEFNGGEFISK